MINEAINNGYEETYVPYIVNYDALRVQDSSLSLKRIFLSYPMININTNSRGPTYELISRSDSYQDTSNKANCTHAML